MSRVALVHDWLVAHRGGEKVLLEIARLFPDAPIFTLVCEPSRVHPELLARTIHTSFLQRLPGAPLRFRQYLPLFPRAIETFDLSGFDLVVSTSHCVAKGVRTRGRHLSYVHTPMRYIWDQLDSYVPRVPGQVWLRRVANTLVQPLRHWDAVSAGRPTRLIANSEYVAQRIERFWGRKASVVYPPVDIERFKTPTGAEPRHGLLVVNALVPYKRTELAVELANRRRLRLTVVGDGPERRALEKLAGSTVRFLPSVDAPTLASLYQGACALIHCGEEDFGIAPVEAMASGTPVIGLGHGGLCETVIDQRTGVLFAEPTIDSLCSAFDRFSQIDFEPMDIRRHVERFSTARFRSEIAHEIEALKK